jgi:tetraacyldisaccharide 4'-kinase
LIAVQTLDRFWYSLNPVALALWPVSLIYRAVVGMRRLAYRRKLLPSYHPGVPVIIVGNLSVGGTGKTPLVAYLVDVLRRAGYRPGVVSRGYGGRSSYWPRQVAANSDPREVGDEPVVLARRCVVPVWVGADRVAAAHALLRTCDCDVIVSDDGLQHYRLARDVEIAVVDGYRGMGNGACLPAGPLREPSGRLREVDFIIDAGIGWNGEYLMTLKGDRAVNLGDPRISRSLARFGDQPVHAVAGIGHPGRFFRSLQAQGINVVEHPLPDHHDFRIEDVLFGDERPVLMTEKDAVKCEAFARSWFWYVPVEAQVDPRLDERLLACLACCPVESHLLRTHTNA